MNIYQVLFAFKDVLARKIFNNEILVVDII